jgi:type IV pilus assembly protein PilW
MMQMHSRHRQAGLSLIELMIGLLISSILILGVTQIFIDNKRSYVFRENQAGNLENGRFALNYLEQELAKTGYRRKPDLDPNYAFPANNALSDCTFAAGETVVWNGTQSTLCIRFQARDANETDCQGNALTAAEKTSIAQPYVSSAPMFIEKFSYDSTNKTLSCVSSRATSGAASALVGNVAALHFEFGIGPSSAKTITSFSTSPATPIRAVTYSILMQSQSSGVRDNSDNPVLTQWKSTYADDSVTDTRQVYQIARGTIVLRNLML